MIHMILRIILMSVVVICGIAALSTKRLAPIIFKKDVSEEKIFKFKLIMFFVMSVTALFLVLSDKI